MTLAALDAVLHRELATEYREAIAHIGNGDFTKALTTLSSDKAHGVYIDAAAETRLIHGMSYHMWCRNRLYSKVMNIWLVIMLVWAVLLLIVSALSWTTVAIIIAGCAFSEVMASMYTQSAIMRGKTSLFYDALKAYGYSSSMASKIVMHHVVYRTRALPLRLSEGFTNTVNQYRVFYK